MIPLTTRTHTPLSIAIVGAGLGGLTAASTLRLFGFDVQIYEQAARDTSWLYGYDAWNDALAYA